MRTFLIHSGLWVLGRALTAAMLVAIGLLVGVGCVLVPQALPWAILGMAGVLLLWVMPDLQSVPTRLASMMLVPFVVSTLSIPVYYAIIVPGLPWISARRVIFGIFAFAVIITLAGSSATRAELVARLKATPIISALVATYCAINLLANVTSSSLAVSIPYTINIYLYEILPFTASVLLVTKSRTVTIVFLTCAICVLIDLVLGAIEVRLSHPFLIYALPSSMRSALLSQAAGFSGLVNNGLRDGMARAQSIYNTALSWGEMAAMMAPITLYFALFGRRAISKLFGVASYLACFASVFFSGSRGGYVGFIAASLLFFVFLVVRLIRTKPNSLIGPTALCLCAILGTATLSSVFFVGRVHKAVLGGAEVQSSNDGRREQWALAEPKIWARPLLGYGPGTAPAVVGWTNAAGVPSLDSYAITLLISLGIPGCIAFFALLIATAYKCFSQYLTGRSEVDQFKLSLGCMTVAYGLYRLTLSQTENNTIFFTLLGLIVSLHGAVAASHRVEHEPTRP